MWKIKDSNYDGNCTACHFPSGSYEISRSMDFCSTECTKIKIWREGGGEGGGGGEDKASEIIFYAHFNRHNSVATRTLGMA